MSSDAIKPPSSTVDNSKPAPLVGVVSYEPKPVPKTAQINPFINPIADFASQLTESSQATGAARGGPGFGVEFAFNKTTRIIDKIAQLGQNTNTLVSILESTKAWGKHGAVQSIS